MMAGKQFRFRDLIEKSKNIAVTVVVLFHITTYYAFDSKARTENLPLQRCSCVPQIPEPTLK